MTINFEPFGDRLLVEVILEEEKTEGGLFIPEANRSFTNKGKVVAVGKGTKNDKGEYESLEVEVGSTVLLAQNAGTVLKLDKKDYKIVSMREVLGQLII